MNDYRINTRSEPFGNIKEEKQQLRHKIITQKPKTKNFYSLIRKREDIFNADFREIYLRRCCYCGISTDIIGRDQFEIDHFVPKTQKNASVNVHDLSNLVSSCAKCNRNKSGILIEQKYVTLLHPDEAEIQKVFYRNETFQIKLNKKYLEDKFIVGFYDKLQLGSFVKQLDFLLMEMKNTLRTSQGWSDKNKLHYREVIETLEQFRRDPYKKTK